MKTLNLCGKKKRLVPLKLIFFLTIYLMTNLLFSSEAGIKKLYFKYSNNKISYLGEKKTIEPTINIRRKIGDWEIVFEGDNHKIIYKTRIFDPTLYSFDLDAPYTSYKAGEKQFKEIIFSVEIPTSIQYKRIFFYELLHPFSIDEEISPVKSNYFKKNISLLTIKEKKIYSPKLKSIDSIKIFSHQKFINNGNDKRRIDIVFIPVQYSESELGNFHKTINFLLYDVCWGGWEDKRTFFDASPMKEFKKLFNFHYLDIINFPMDWQEEIACSGDSCKEWLDNLIKKFIPVPPDIYVFVVKTFQWSSLSSYWSIIIRDDSCGNVLLRAFSRSSIGGGLYNEFDTTDNCKDEKAKEIISRKNITVFTDKDLIPWKHWILDSTPLPTPNTLTYKNTVGAFEGGYDYKCYYYRPQEKCVLHGDLWDFCKVCREYFTLTLLDNWFDPYVSAKSNVPSQGMIIYPSDTPFLNFFITVDEGLLSMLDTPNIVWLLDDKPIEGTDGKRGISINTSLLKAGKHTVKVAIVGEVVGTTGFVRKYHDNHYYYTFPEFEIGKGKFKRQR